MATSSPFRISVAELLRRHGASRDLHVAEPLAGLGSPGAEISPDVPVTIDGTLERISEGIVVRGTVTAQWTAPCARCLTPVTGTIQTHVDELFEPHPLAGETYELEVDVIDLEPLVRDALLLELPAVPVCRDDCAGLCPQCGADRNTTSCD